MQLKKITVASMLAPLLAVAALALPPAASAEARTARSDWVNSSIVVWKNPFGQCWQGRHWIPAMSGEECAGDAPTRQPALLLAPPRGERPALAMHTAADDSPGHLTPNFDASTHSESGRTMITRCLTTHN